MWRELERYWTKTLGLPWQGNAPDSRQVYEDLSKRCPFNPVGLGRSELPVVRAPVLEHVQAAVDDAIDVGLAVVDAREWLIGHRNLEELAQRLPAVAGLPDEELVRRNVAAHGLGVGFEAVDQS